MPESLPVRVAKPFEPYWERLDTGRSESAITPIITWSRPESCQTCRKKRGAKCGGIAGLLPYPDAIR